LIVHFVEIWSFLNPWKKNLQSLKALFSGYFSRLQPIFGGRKIVDAVDDLDSVDSGIIQQLQRHLKSWKETVELSENPSLTSCRQPVDNL